MALKKGQMYEGVVSGYKFPNKGKVVIDGFTVSVKNSLPGQKIKFYLNKKHSGTGEGRLMEVIQKSPLENAEPKCSHFGECGGCSYQQISYENQLELKSGLVKEMLEKVYPEFEFEGILPSPITEGYRNKMEFSFGDESKGGPFALGLHRKASFHDIVNLKDCSIVHSDFNVIRNAIRDYFNDFYLDSEVDFYHSISHEGYLRHLLLRRAAKTGELLVALVTATPEAGAIEKEFEKQLLDGMVELLKNLELEGKIAGICHVCNDSMADVVKNDGTEILYGRDWIEEELLGLKFRISIFSFFQTNPLGAEVLYSKAREYALENGLKKNVIYDLYCGTGTITQLMSVAAEKVIGVEIVEEAVEKAKENAELNGISNVQFIAGDCMKVLCGEIGENLPKPDLVILDPPREGIHPKALGKILGYGVDRIVYISCKPTSLAAELESFKAAGYELKKAACVDMFPGTVHVETVVCLGKKNAKPKDYVEIGLDAEDYYKIKDSKKE